MANYLPKLQTGNTSWLKSHNLVPFRSFSSIHFPEGQRKAFIGGKLQVQASINRQCFIGSGKAWGSVTVYDSPNSLKQESLSVVFT